MFKYRRRFCATLASFAFLVSAGCASIPQTEFNTYRDAFDQARTAGQEVLLDVSVAEAECIQRALCAEKNASQDGKPSTATPKVALPYQRTYQSISIAASGENIAISERIRAFEVISRYNQILTDLAEGKSVAQVSKSANVLVEALTSIVGLTPALGNLFSNLAVAFEKARSREEFVRAIRAGEKPISNIFAFLAADIPSYYEIRRILVEKDRNLVLTRLSTRVQVAEATVLGLSLPTNSEWKDDWKAHQSAINDELKKMGGLPSGGRSYAEFKFSGKGEWNNLTSQQMAGVTNEVAKDVRDYLAIVEKINTYFALLQKYERLLDATKQAMIKLRLAVDSPQDFGTQFEDMFQMALLVRRDFIKYRNQN